jgi:hypothetical protein
MTFTTPRSRANPATIISHESSVVLTRPTCFSGTKKAKIGIVPARKVNNSGSCLFIYKPPYVLLMLVMQIMLVILLVLSILVMLIMLSILIIPLSTLIAVVALAHCILNAVVMNFIPRDSSTTPSPKATINKNFVMSCPFMLPRSTGSLERYALAA